LEWVTTGEQNTAFFQLERSADGQTFDPLGQAQTAAGRSTEPRRYTQTDPKPIPGIGYYRVKQTDTDGRFSYSAVIEFDNTPFADEIRLSDNPPAGVQPVLQIPATTDGELTLEITDMAGRQHLKLVTGTKGDFPLPVAGLPAGLYTLKITGKRRTWQYKLLLPGNR
jgi:hypothetical protein